MARGRFASGGAGYGDPVGLGVGIFLVAIGAILTFAVHNPHNGSVNVHVVGVILMCAGFASFLLSLLYWESWLGWGAWGRRRAYTAQAAPPAAPAYRWYQPTPYWARRRTTYVEEAPPEVPPPGY